MTSVSFVRGQAGLPSLLVRSSAVALQRTVATSLLDKLGMGAVPGPGPKQPLADIPCDAQLLWCRLWPCLGSIGRSAWVSAGSGSPFGGPDQAVVQLHGPG